jgi:dihydropteroate synthase
MTRFAIAPPASRLCYLVEMRTGMTVAETLAEAGEIAKAEADRYFRIGYKTVMVRVLDIHADMPPVDVTDEAIAAFERDCEEAEQAGIDRDELHADLRRYL